MSTVRRAEEPKPLFPNLRPARYHLDKNGREINYMHVDKLRHDCGKIYSLSGTGEKRPGDGDLIYAFNEDNKLVILNVKQVAIVRTEINWPAIGAVVFVLGWFWLLVHIFKSGSAH